MRSFPASRRLDAQLRAFTSRACGYRFLLMSTSETAPKSSLLVDAGWGDWRIADNPNTRVTFAQVEAIGALDVEDLGASDVRFGEQTGGIFASLTDGSFAEIGEDGSVETFDA